MQNSITAGATSAAIALLVLTAGCSGGSKIAELPPALHEQSVRPDNPPCTAPTSPLVYVSQYRGNNIRVYTQNPYTWVNSIGGLNRPIGIDIHGARLYVANFGTKQILVFKNCGDALPPLGDATGFPSGVAFDPSGNLYVANRYDNGAAPGEVRYYANASGPGLTIGDPNLSSVYFITVDTAGDVFADGFSSANTSEVDWCHNTTTNVCTSGNATWQNTGITVNFPGGMRINGSGNLIINDQLGSMKTYAVPGFTQVGATIPCPGSLSNCVDFGLNQAGNQIYIAATKAGKAWQKLYPSGNGQLPILPGLTVFGEPVGATAWPAPPWGG